MLAIVSPIKDYQICWHLNKALGIDLIRGDSLFAISEDHVPGSEFSFYEHYDALNETNYYLASNKARGSIYAPQFKQFDYFLEVKEQELLGVMGQVIDKVRGISDIQACLEINSQDLKAPQKFVFYDYS